VWIANDHNFPIIGTIANMMRDWPNTITFGFAPHFLDALRKTSKQSLTGASLN
jgi:hypothetical protein